MNTMELLEPIHRLHELIRDQVIEATERSALEDLSTVARDEEGDTIYAVDCVGEELLIDFLEREVAASVPIVLIAEGLPGGKVILPRGVSESEAAFRIIVDPIDGTRGLMYQKRSAWILTGVAPNLGPETSLGDIECAIQTEIPIIKQYLADAVWAFAGQGAQAERWNRLTGERTGLTLRPSSARTIAHGYAQISRFFPGAREELASIDEQIVLEALGPVKRGKAHCFEDQYPSTGGQLYELMSGHDRFIADLRPLMDREMSRRGRELGICCHPYDICTELIARELGVIVTDEAGGRLRPPLSVEPDVAWAGYANEAIRAQIAPLLQKAIRDRGLSLAE